MSDSSLFNAPVEPTQETTDPSSASIDAFAHQLFAIKNERGEPKYTSLSTALDALKHSQEYIPQLQTQNDQYQPISRSECGPGDNEYARRQRFATHKDS